MPKENELTIRLTAKADLLTVESFFTAVNETIKVLQNVGKKILNNADQLLQWRIVKITMSSPLEMTIDSGLSIDRDTGKRIVAASVFGMKTMEESEEMPPCFDSRTVNYAKNIVRVLNESVSEIEFQTADMNSVKITPILAANADAITKKIQREHYSWTTLEGTLDYANIHEKSEFKIFDVMTDESVKCIIPEAWLEVAKQSLGRRVLISGEVKYKDDKATSIRVEKIAIIPSDEQLPQIQDFQNMNITGGLDSEEYLWRLHNAG